MSIEAMKQALEALYLFATDESPEGYEAISAITALRTAIEQPEKQAEPFGHFQYDIKLDAWVKSKTNNGIAFYTTPPKREWVGLTDDDIEELWDAWKDALSLDHKTWALAIETKLKEKNT